MAQPSNDGFGLPNLKIPTLGGKQFWTDHLWRQGWRIQNNALTGHWRLLDANNVRQAWGSRIACEAALDTESLDNSLETKQAVILLHGLMRSSGSMSSLGESLAESQRESVQESEPDIQDSPYTVIYFEYASSRSSIGNHALALREVIAGLPSDVTLSFVGHSMGNIVVRHLIGDLQRAEDHETLNRITKVVMLGPPNQGSSIARQLSKTGLFGVVTGKGGLELGPGWSEFASKLATPHCPFGIIAGRLPESVLTSNPLVDGQGDFVVSVDETKLDGAADFLEVPRLHSFLMDDKSVQQAVKNFLREGKFE